MVFVGGVTTGLLITDEGAAEVRPTDDVDSIVEATTYVEYMSFAERLKNKGFRIDTREDAPLCRWVKDSIVLDVMPLDENILGFTNRWYKQAIKRYATAEISSEVIVRVLTPPYFCATKLEAFEGRGNSDFFMSHDLEDLIAVIDGREEIVAEIADAETEVREYVASKLKTFLEDRAFRDALPGHLLPDPGNQARLPFLVERISQISSLGPR